MLKYSEWGLTSAGIVFGKGEFSSGLPSKTALDPSVGAGTCRLPPITRGWDLKLVLLWYSPGHQDDSLSSFPVSPAFCHIAPSSSLAWSKEPPSELLSSLWFNTRPCPDWRRSSQLSTLGSSGREWFCSHPDTDPLRMTCVRGARDWPLWRVQPDLGWRSSPWLCLPIFIPAPHR